LVVVNAAAAATDAVDTVVDVGAPVVGTLLVFVDVPLATATVADSSVPAAPASLFFLYLRDGRKRSLNDGIQYDYDVNIRL
jgi:hypothetical protein